MAAFACPGCGANVVLHSPASIFVVCSFCKSTLIRDRDWQNYGKMADLPADITPLQIGTKGLYQGEGFELIGRLRLRYTEGTWTEWCASFSKGRVGWLAVAQGLLMMSVPVPPPPQLKDLGLCKPGDRISLEKLGTFQIDDIKTATVEASEGELPFPAPAQQKLRSIDASDPSGRFLSLEQDAPSGEIRAYAGEYLEFDDFHFQNLRQLDDW